MSTLSTRDYFEAGVHGDVVRPVGEMLAKLYDVFVFDEVASSRA